MADDAMMRFLLQRVLASAAPSTSPLTLAYDVCHGFVARAALESL